MRCVNRFHTFYRMFFSFIFIYANKFVNRQAKGIEYADVCNYSLKEGMEKPRDPPQFEVIGAPPFFYGLVLLSGQAAKPLDFIDFLASHAILILVKKWSQSLVLGGSLIP